MKRSRRLVAAVVCCAALGIGAAACSSDDNTSTANTTATTGASASSASQPVGAGCSAIPKDGAGSTAGMAQDPAATAASNNPALSTLVSAVQAAGLVDTLNDTSAKYTIFAPANSAFEKIPAADLQALLADKAMLTDVLTYHVYAGQEYKLDQLPSTLQMVNGGTVQIAPDGQTAKINGQSVVVCGNVETANATVHIIDTVLMPGSTGATAKPVGAACSAIPADGAGSTAGMAQDPAATAASNNPVLSTLVSAVQAAGLVDTLNDTSAKYTIFAPSNDAFAKIPAADLQALLANQQMLTDVLTYHVYAGQEYMLNDLPSTLMMVNGDSVQIAPDGQTAKINGQSVVICGNVETANATVHIIDTVLMPPS
jgi:transforming growth factor-beta-induced protein